MGPVVNKITRSDKHKTFNQRFKKDMAQKRFSSHYPDLPPSYEDAVGVGLATTAGEPKLKGDPPGGPQPQQPNVFVQYIQAPDFGSEPINMTCPYCLSLVRTRVVSEGPGPTACLFGAILCLLGFWFCALVPCCLDSGSVTHSCPNCRKFLGSYSDGC